MPYNSDIRIITITRQIGCICAVHLLVMFFCYYPRIFCEGIFFVVYLPHKQEQLSPSVVKYY